MGKRMNNQNRSIFFISLLLALLLLFVATSTIAQLEVEDQREFDYSQGGKKGPNQWGDIKEEWATCKNGKMQSPIDMSHERVKIIQKPDKGNYKPANAAVVNRGHDIMVEWVGDAGSIFIDSTEYLLRQVHWHSPSEHTVNGKRYDVELHMVHKSNDKNAKNNIAVLGVLYEIGQPDAFLSKLMQNISSLIDHEVSKVDHLEVIDPREIQIASPRYHRYVGSLTTPPCTEGVIWTITEKVGTVSINQVNLLRDAVHDYATNNARPLQPQNNREIDLYGPEEIIA